MAEIINALTDGVTFKAPAHMSGPSVHKFKKQVMASFESEPKSVVIDFGDVDFIDVHGLVLLRDLCEVIRVYGVRAFAYQLNGQMQELLGGMELVEDLGDIKPEAFALMTA
jgi:anti-anti-sigma regulatory factor